MEEVAPASSYRARGATFKAYEDTWWDKTRVALAPFCRRFATGSMASYSFIVYADSGGIVQAIVPRAPADLQGADEIRRTLLTVELPAFTPQQALERKTIGMRGNLIIKNRKCYLQRA